LTIVLQTNSPSKELVQLLLLIGELWANAAALVIQVSKKERLIIVAPLRVVYAWYTLILEIRQMIHQADGAYKLPRFKPSPKWWIEE